MFRYNRFMVMLAILFFTCPFLSRAGEDVSVEYDYDKFHNLLMEKQYSEIIEKGEPFLESRTETIEDLYVLWTIAESYDELNKQQEAINVYRRLLKDFALIEDKESHAFLVNDTKRYLERRTSFPFSMFHMLDKKFGWSYQTLTAYYKNRFRADALLLLLFIGIALTIYILNKTIRPADRIGSDFDALIKSEWHALPILALLFWYFIVQIIRHCFIDGIYPNANISAGYALQYFIWFLVYSIPVLAVILYVEDVKTIFRPPALNGKFLVNLLFSVLLFVFSFVILAGGFKLFSYNLTGVFPNYKPIGSFSILDAGLLCTFLFVLALLPAIIAQELIYRGILYKYFKSNLGMVAALIFSSMLFTFSQPQSIDQIRWIVPFSFGIFLGFITDRARSLIPAVICHFVYGVWFYT